ERHLLRTLRRGGAGSVAERVDPDHPAVADENVGGAANIDCTVSAGAAAGAAPPTGGRIARPPRALVRPPASQRAPNPPRAPRPPPPRPVSRPAEEACGTSGSTMLVPIGAPTHQPFAPAPSRHCVASIRQPTPTAQALSVGPRPNAIRRWRNSSGPCAPRW